MPLPQRTRIQTNVPIPGAGAMKAGAVEALGKWRADARVPSVSEADGR